MTGPKYGEYLHVVVLPHRLSLDGIINYIQSQRQHHAKKTFQEEYLEFLKKHEVEYDKRYVWG